MNTDELKDWILRHEIEKRTIECFWLNFRCYETEEQEECKHFFGSFDEAELQVKISQIALMLGNYPKFDYNHIVSYIPIIYKGKNIGLYRLYFEYSGAISDDYFTLY
ncbi:hypothetical protein [Paenibacillus sp. WLX2291]|uniref:hypothetical protein n=1 Tax=Paenibacillus sp. WLX2291 TaxID=3296934 RepID=UPI003983E18A